MHVHVYDACALCLCACVGHVPVCMSVVCVHVRVHVCDHMCYACACALCPRACVWCVRVHACGMCPCACVWRVPVCMSVACVCVHVCDYVWYVCAHRFCTLGASAEPLPGDKGLIEGACSRAALRSCRGSSPGIFSKRRFLVVTPLPLGSDAPGPAGPENIRWGVLREGGSGWGAVAGQPGALSTSGAEERCAWTRGAPRISAGRVLREGGLGWGALAGQPGALSTSEESPDITRA